MKNELKQIIKKIQKLYRLAEGAGTEEEAQAAAMRARELLSKYNLGISDIDNFIEDECEEALFIIKKNYLPEYAKLLVGGMCLLFQCKSILKANYKGNRNRQAIVFVGVGADALVASQTYQFLVSFAQRKFREYKLPTTYRSDYLYGYAATVLSRIREMTEKIMDIPEEKALVPVKDAALKDYLKRKYPDMTGHVAFRNRSRTDAAALGARDGKTVSLSRQINGSETRALE